MACDEFPARRHVRTVYISSSSSDLRVNPLIERGRALVDNSSGSCLAAAASPPASSSFKKTQVGRARLQRPICIPAQSNFSGVRHPLSGPNLSQETGYRVLLDGTAVPLLRQSLRPVRPREAGFHPRQLV